MDAQIKQHNPYQAAGVIFFYTFNSQSISYLLLHKNLCSRLIYYRVDKLCKINVY